MTCYFGDEFVLVTGLVVLVSSSSTVFNRLTIASEISADDDAADDTTFLPLLCC